VNLLRQIWQAGVVGCGGAGFPTHFKWNSGAEHFIINAVECEPLLCTDRYLMRTYADAIVSACRSAADILQAKYTTIGLKRSYSAEIAALEDAISRLGADISIHKLDNFYPAGDEHVLVREVMGKTVPYGRIPLDVGAVVSNVATMVAVGDAMENRPLVEKYVTVTGEVGTPCIVKAPVGTPVEECIRAAGGALVEDPLIIAGGPLMGTAISQRPEERRVVTKTTSGLLLFKKDSYMGHYQRPLELEHLRKQAASACIQCNYCTMLCPRNLLGHPLQPSQIMRAISAREDTEVLLRENESVRNVSLCTLCGVCTVYACPMGLRPSRVNEYLRNEMAALKIRGARGESTAPLPGREWRKIPSERIAARAGVLKYESRVSDKLVTVHPREVVIGLRQGIGKPPVPVVEPGGLVEAGELIAEISEDALGANLHASISGTVVEVSDVIRIVG